jgi:outer membrane biogenesis lipoprotein LolB
MLVGCKTSAGGVAGSGAEIRKSEVAFFTSVVDHSFRFNTLSARIKLDFKSPQKEMSARAQLKMIYDDRMQISIQPFLGIEVFRIELTRDSIKILDRMNKRYLAENYKKLKNKTLFDFNFHNLQALFTNNLFIPGESGVSSGQMRRFQITKDQYTAQLKIKDAADLFYTFTADGEEKLCSTSIRDKAEKYSLTWDYSDFQEVGKQQFPFKMKAGLISDQQTQGSVSFSFFDAVIDNPLKTDFHIPAEYTRVTFSQILKLLDKQ